MRAAWSTVASRLGTRALVARLAIVATVGAVVGAVAGAREPGLATASPSPVLASLPLARDGAAPRFENVTRAVGLGHVQRASSCDGNVAGAAWADFDGDGRLDLYLPEPSGRGRLELGATGGRFRDVRPAAAGIPEAPFSAATAVDFDGDGRTDLYLVARGRNRLLRNVGAGRFADVTRRSGLGDTGSGSGAAWADVDGDGRLDVYVVNADNCGPPRPSPDRLFRGLGHGRFADESRLLGQPSDGIGLQAAWVPQGSGGLPALFVANDHMGFRPNVLWRRDRHGAFHVDQRASLAMSSMGVGLGDLLGRGTLDLVVSDLRRPPVAMLMGGRGLRARRLPGATGEAAPIG